MKIDFTLTPRRLWRIGPVIALTAACMGSALADVSSQPEERHGLATTAEEPAQIMAPEPRGILGPDLSTIGLDFEMSRLDDDTGFIPPDTMGDVGPDHIIELINGRFEIYDIQTGAVLESLQPERVLDHRGRTTHPAGQRLPGGRHLRPDRRRLLGGRLP